MPAIEGGRISHPQNANQERYQSQKSAQSLLNIQYYCIENLEQHL